MLQKPETSKEEPEPSEEEREMDADGTFELDSITPRINIESSVWPRIDIVRSLIEEWKRASKAKILFNTLKYTIQKKRGRRYLIA